jgi:nicotinamide-nucleotide amidase
VARAEVLCIGTELLLGDVLDTNSQFLAKELALLGVDSFYRVVVGDNPERIKECVRQALRRADVVITSGGLGPTADDLTTECLAQVFDAQMEMDEEVLAFIQALFASRNLRMTESNRKQALRPRGADILPNPVGSAPGMVWQLSQEDLAKVGIDTSYVSAVGVNAPFRTILTFPGVPSELTAMWHETAGPYLAKHYPAGTIWSTELKHIGIGESALAEKFRHLLDLPNPTVAPYAGRWECRLRVAAKAATQDEARKLAQPVIDEISTGSGITLYGRDNDTLEAVAGGLLAKQGKTLGVAESCTGGLIMQRLTEVPGSSKYLGLGIVAYSNDAKHKILGVDEALLALHGAVSVESATAMAIGMLKLAQTDLAIAVTGIAGPDGGTADKPVGLVYVCLAVQPAGDGAPQTFVRKLSLGARINRSEVRYRTANEALNMVRLYLLEPQALKS